MQGAVGEEAGRLGRAREEQIIEHEIECNLGVHLRDVKEKCCLFIQPYLLSICYLPEAVLGAWIALVREMEKAKQKTLISPATSILKQGRQSTKTYIL